MDAAQACIPSLHLHLHLRLRLPLRELIGLRSAVLPMEHETMRLRFLSDCSREGRRRYVRVQAGGNWKLSSSLPLASSSDTYGPSNSAYLVPCLHAMFPLDLEYSTTPAANTRTSTSVSTLNPAPSPAFVSDFQIQIPNAKRPTHTIAVKPRPSTVGAAGNTALLVPCLPSSTLRLPDVASSIRPRAARKSRPERRPSPFSLSRSLSLSIYIYSSNEPSS
jgi:hypothetical protein